MATCRKAGGVAIVAHRGEVTMGAERGLGICIYDIWVNYNELTTTSLEIIVSKGNHPRMALIQVSELL